MLSHIVVGARDVEESRAFYDAVLGALGVSPGRIDSFGRAVYGGPVPLFVGKPINGEPPSHANGGTIGFAANSAQEVRSAYAAGLARGGVSFSAPGLRETVDGNFFAALLRDPVGNKLCILHPVLDG
jgi:catechol 2,3-dioxygenase-like lactoylglutathione lyase family enzyme